MLNSDVIRTGHFENAKNGDVINIGAPVDRDSYVIVLPIYNFATTICCNFDSTIIYKENNSFTLYAYDTVIGNVSTSQTLSGRYFIVPINE